MTTDTIPQTRPSRSTDRRRRAATGWIGVDIGKESIKIAQVDLFRGQFRLRVATEIPKSEVSAESESDGDLIASALRKLNRSQLLAGSDVACVLPESAYQCDRIEISGTGIPHRDEITRQTAQRMALPESEVGLDFWLLDSLSSETENLAVQVVACNNRKADRLAKAVGKTGFSVVCLDSPLTAAERCARWHQTDFGAGATVIINWGSTDATLTAVVDRTPDYHRAFRDAGFSNCVNAVAERFQISTADALVLLRQYGLPVSTSSISQQRIATTLFGVLRPALRTFRDEFERTTAYLQRKLRLGQPVGVVLTGLGATMPGLQEWLSDDTGIRCERWLPRCSSMSRICQASLPDFANAISLSALRFEEAAR